MVLGLSSSYYITPCLRNQNEKDRIDLFQNETQIVFCELSAKWLHFTKKIFSQQKFVCMDLSIQTIKTSHGYKISKIEVI